MPSGSTPTRCWGPRTARWSAGCPTGWASRAPTSRSTPPARPRSSPSTWPARRSVPASAASPSPAAPTSCSIRWARCTSAGCARCRPPGAATASPPPPTATSAPTAPAWSSSSGCPMPAAAPTGPSQQAVIRDALRRAGVAPASVDYLECHGTGTPLGDPVEVQAAAAVLGEGRQGGDDALILGTIKSNLGHTEGAAGVAGLLKAVLALGHARIPKTLHFDAPNPHIPWDTLPVRVASEALPWPRNGHPRRAGVSSFGFSGTNAHVVLEEAPPEPARDEAPPERDAELVVLSARSEAALADVAARLRDHLAQHDDLALVDLAFSLATTRTHHDHRAAIPATSPAALSAALDALARGDTPAATSRAQLPASRGGIAWLFTGQGAQRLGMGRGLYAAWPVFRDALDAAFAALAAATPDGPRLP